MNPIKRHGLGTAIAEFLRDLMAGDPVALTLVALLLGFLLVLGVAGFFIVWGRQRQQEAHRRKLKRRSPDEEQRYERMKDVNL